LLLRVLVFTMSKDRPENDVGTGCLFPQDWAKEGLPDFKGTLKAPLVVPAATLRDLVAQCPANGSTVVIEGDFRVHGWWKTTENSKRMISLQLWATNQAKPTNLKDIVWRLVQEHPEIELFKVSEMHKRWLRAYSTDDITKTVRLLDKEDKVNIDPEGSRWNSCWFRVAQPS
jgi:hypothetical protein